MISLLLPFGLSESGRYRLAREIRYRRIFDEGVIILQDRAEVVMVNATAIDVLELIDRGYHIDAVADELAARYACDQDTLDSDVLDYVIALWQAGILENDEPTRTDPTTDDPTTDDPTTDDPGTDKPDPGSTP